MKKLTFLLLITGVFVLPGCKDYVDEYVTYTVNEPVFMSTAEFRSAVDVEQPRSIEKQGKIVFYNDFLYVSQPEEGIHVIDNRDPSNPKNIAFVELLGNADMHVRNGVLYADSYVDLVWFDIDDPAKPEFKGRKEEVFPQAFPPTENGYGIDYAKSMDRSNGIVIGWKTVEKKELVRTYKPRWWSWGGVSEDMAYSSAPSGGGGVGAVGSMSRFAIYQDNLYTVMSNYLGIFDLSDETPRKIGQDMYVGFDVETIFSYKNCMFMGTPTGMIIYSLEDPLKPEYQSRITHVFGCDPVVVENDIAYVTICSGTFCGQTANELIIVDVSNVKQPKHIVTYNMESPRGLGIDNGTLFVCDGGLRVYNAEDPRTIMHKDNVLAHFKNIVGFDVIPFNNVLMMIAEDGIYQYDYSDPENIRQLSRLPVGK
ncbi:LVIVD repeat-containing protein [Proteiniphilum sp. UBA5384]|uniref:LVIVD repeat-containing protein n=1 Tax=Proteiniphilum sp. UBA5384 TaxID=1947279 RepID=UPI0025D29B17|nr:hypothetical protein [Proteiniphilum sp. UBA5384]